MGKISALLVFILEMQLFRKFSYKILKKLFLRERLRHQYFSVGKILPLFVFILENELFRIFSHLTQYSVFTLKQNTIL